MKKRILSLLMALTLCLSLLPTMALAKGSTLVNVTGVKTSSGNGANTMTLEGTFEAEDGTKSVKLTFMLDVDYVSGTIYSTKDDPCAITLASAEIDGMDAGNVKNASITVTKAKSGGLLEISAHMAVGKYENAPLYAHWDNYQEHDDVKFEPWMPTEETPLPTEAGNYYLTDDVTLNETWTVPAGTTNLCLNGHVIKLANDATGSVINAFGNATLNLYDCNDDAWPHLFAYSKTGAWELLESYEGEAPVTIDEITSATEEGTAVLVEGGVITGGTGTSSYSSLCGGAVFVGGGATFNMYGGNIVGNHVTGCGGGVYVLFANSGSTTFNLYGGRICGNAAPHGAGVHMNGNAFTMYGGSIENNTATGNGGGVCINSNGFTMHGGTIRNNVANNNGGGVCNGGSGFAMDGGTITGNTVNGNYGGGVYVGNTSITLGGDAKIIGNTVNNLYLGTKYTSGDMTVTFGDGSTVAEPKSGMKVSVTLVSNDDKGPFTDENESYEAYANYFEADKTYQYILFEDSKIQVNRVNTSSKKVNISPSEHGVVYTDKQIAGNGDTVTLTVVPENGYVLKSLKYNDGTDHDIAANAQGAYEFTMPNMAVTVAAVFAPSWGKLNDALAGTPGSLDGLFTVADNAGVRTIKLLTDITADMDDTALLVPANKTVVLDLNGFVLDRGLIAADGTATHADQGSVIAVAGELTVKDSGASKEHKFTQEEISILTYDEVHTVKQWVRDENAVSGYETVTGGCIIGGTGTYTDFSSNYYYYYVGGGVNIMGGGKLTVKGGNIVGNTANNGGGVWAVDGASFVLNDGGVIGNIAYFDQPESKVSNDVGGNGGGVCICGLLNEEKNAQFEMNGGKISRNTADSTGGVELSHALFTMNGGEISDNEAQSAGGIDVCSSEARITNGKICRNKVTNNASGGGIFVDNHSKLYLTAGVDKSVEITDNVGTRTNWGTGIKNYFGEVHLSGKVIVKDNLYSPETPNGYKPVNLTVYTNQYSNKPIIIDGPLTDSEIHVSFIAPVIPVWDKDEEEYYYDDDEAPGVLTSGYKLNSGAVNAGKADEFFRYDGPDTLKMIVNEAGELEVVDNPAPPPPSGGSGSTPTVTVPVTGDENTVNVSASVSGTTATVKAITDAELDKVTGGEAVEINLTGLKKDIDTAKIPTATVEKIGDKGGMSVKLTTATVTFDKAATQEISAQAGGNTIQLVVDDIKEVSLNAVQKEAVKKLDTALIIDAYLVSNGTRLCSESKGGFNGGKATVALPFEIKNNRTSANYSVYYVDDAGNLEKLNAKYDSKLGAFVFDITHFSNYVVAYDENAALAFTDVPVDQYFYNAVTWAAANGITEGTSATTFSPYAPVTRAQVVTFLWRTAGCPEPKGDASKFTDVEIGSYYEKAVAWAIEQVITKGTSATTFTPDAVCTRGQIVTFLARFAGVADDATGYTHGFTDVKATDYFNNAVAWAKDNKVTEGTSATTFSPNDDCTRAQVVTFLYRWMVK